MKPEIKTIEQHTTEAQMLGLTGILAAEYVRAKGRSEIKALVASWEVAA